MPKGTYCTATQKKRIVDEYFAKELTVDQICAKHGIARRTLYQWLEKINMPMRGRNGSTRKAVYLSRDEVETILLLILESKEITRGKYAPHAKVLEQKLLDIADEMEEYSASERR